MGLAQVAEIYGPGHLGLAGSGPGGWWRPWLGWGVGWGERVGWGWLLAGRAGPAAATKQHGDQSANTGAPFACFSRLRSHLCSAAIPRPIPAAAARAAKCCTFHELRYDKQKENCTTVATRLARSILGICLLPSVKLSPSSATQGQAAVLLSFSSQL